MKKFVIAAIAFVHFAGYACANALPTNVILQPAQPARVSQPTQNHIVAVNHNAANVNNQVVSNPNKVQTPIVKQNTAYKPASPVA